MRPPFGTFQEGYDHGAADASQGLPRRYRQLRRPGGAGDYRRGYDAGYLDNWIDPAEVQRLYIEHRDTDIHTGDNYVDGCPTCDPRP